MSSADGGREADPERVRDACRKVVDPCSAALGSNLDVVEMGLVKSVAVEDGHAEVDMRLTTPACHMVAYFHEEIEAEVGALAGIESVAVETDHGLEWSEELMSEEAKRRRQAVLDEHRARYEQETAAGVGTDRGEPDGEVTAE